MSHVIIDNSLRYWIQNVRNCRGIGPLKPLQSEQNYSGNGKESQQGQKKN